jgi:tRNA threonylcarbamoyladenosine modification (KEOPS) complex  Pcc1 subunit
MPKGGIRIPSEDKVKEVLENYSKEYSKRIELARNKKPQIVKVYARDVKRIRAIGNGNFRDGFYRVLKTAHSLWLTSNEVKRLRALSKSGNCAREGLIKALEIAEKECSK